MSETILLGIKINREVKNHWETVKTFYEEFLMEDVDMKHLQILDSFLTEFDCNIFDGFQFLIVQTVL